MSSEVHRSAASYYPPEQAQPDCADCARVPPEGNARCCPTAPSELQGSTEAPCGSTRAAFRRSGAGAHTPKPYFKRNLKIPSTRHQNPSNTSLKPLQRLPEELR
ncbi:hypothetical protein NDU88_000360 [Pleurodeles waltl]|uniref:Uncharacterized protein n=1 Tax=Pleurodeles waltl TaxID=8319 RepID=A0AAV7TES4_PLEWA|nr:hypothetical protein NDU88_000360 [Pleurodeles waltl]